MTGNTATSSSRFGAAVCLGSLSLLCTVSCTTSMVSSKPIESIGPGRDAGIVSYSLPKTLVRVILPDSRSVRPSQVVVESDAIADPVHTYVLEYQRNLFSSDQLTVTLAPHTPFIASVNGFAQDQTTETLTAAAESATRLSVVQFSDDQRNTVERTFDPHDRNQMDAVRAELIGRFGIDIACLLGCEPPTPRPAEEADGIYARGTMPLALAICEDTCREGRPPARIVTIASYNASPLIHIPVRRTAFSDRQTVLTFDRGTVKSVQHVKPSEVLEVAKLPGAIVASIFTGLGAAVTDRDSLVDQQILEIQEQTKLTEALRLRTEKQAELVAKQKELPDFDELKRVDPVGAIDVIIDSNVDL